MRRESSFEYMREFGNGDQSVELGRVESTIRDLPRDKRLKFAKDYERYYSFLERVADLRPYYGKSQEHSMSQGGEETDDTGFGSVIVNQFSNIAVTSLLNRTLSAARRLENVYDFTPRFHETLMKNPITESKSTDLTLPVQGVTLSEILHQGSELAQKKPINVYSHLLRRSFGRGIDHTLISDAGESTEYSLDVLICTNVRPELFKFLLREFSELPAFVTDPALELHNTFQDALRQTQRIFYNPDSSSFSELTQINEFLTQQGTATQRGLFLEQMVGGSPGDLHRSYRRIKTLISQGKQKEFYGQFLSIIEDSFDGLLGSEVADALGFEEAPRENTKEVTGSLKQLSKKFLQKTSDQSGSIISDHDFTGSRLTPSDVSVIYKKDGRNTSVGVKITIEDAEGRLNNLLCIINQDGVDWNLLYLPAEQPGLFHAIAEIAERALQNVVTPPPSRTFEVSGQREASPTLHIRDEIYSLRKEKQKSEDTLESNTQVESVSESTFRPSAFMPEDIAAKIPLHLLETAYLAIEKYNKGLQPAVKLQFLKGSNAGRNLRRIRSGKVRVILEQIEDTLVVVDVGDRRDIYRD